MQANTGRNHRIYSHSIEILKGMKKYAKINDIYVQLTEQ
jgi:hypothetical protein